MSALALHAALTGVQSVLTSAAGPLPALGYAVARAKVGLSDPAMARSFQYWLEAEGVKNVAGAKGYVPAVLDPSALIRMTHQFQPIGDGPLAGGISDDNWAWLKNRLTYFGIDLAGQNDATARPVANDWRRFVQLSASAAPIDASIRAWQRTRFRGDDAADEAESELTFCLRRAGFSRFTDRQRLLEPYAHWSTLDAERLAWLGQIDEVTRIALYRAAGNVQAEDQGYARWLHARIPDSETLYDWARRQVWNEDIAALYNLDAAFESSPIAKFFARAQGDGVMPGQLNGQPPGETDWLKLAMRAHTPILGFREAVELQRRLRPSEADPAQSVVPGIPSWRAGNTRDMLLAAGYTEPFASRLMGLVNEPINIRIVNHILTETLKHPALAAQAQQLMGQNVDWVKNAFLDHGFAEPIAKVTADAIRQAADDSANAERLELEKKQREQTRALVLRKYELGTITDDNAVDALVGQFVTREMALAMLLTVDETIRTDFVQTATAEIKAAFLEGKLSVEQVGGQLMVLGVNPTRQAYYIQEWVWQRNDRQRLLSTGEIITALKQGLFTPEVALLRLENLGWTAPDAMVEIALAEHEIQAAAARVQQTAAAKAISDRQRQEREAAAAAKAKAAAEAKAKRDAGKLAKEESAATIQQDIAINKYAATALVDLDAYNKAAKHKDQNKMDAEIDKAAAAYKELLLEQLRLSQISEKVADETERVEPVAIPPAQASEGASKDAASAPPSDSAASTEDGGAESAPGA